MCLDITIKFLSENIITVWKDPWNLLKVYLKRKNECEVFHEGAKWDRETFLETTHGSAIHVNQRLLLHIMLFNLKCHCYLFQIVTKSAFLFTPCYLNVNATYLFHSTPWSLWPIPCNPKKLSYQFHKSKVIPIP